MKPLFFCLLTALFFAQCRPAEKPETAQPETVSYPATLTLPKNTLQDKIKGGWAGQTIGVTFGEPTEFRYNGTFIQDYQRIEWSDTYLKETFANNPGLYDDIYMDLTFVEVFERDGLDASAQQHANAFAHAGYMLWHANQQARYNILNGIAPPQSGHWLNNPEADAIDFQIEADFAGLMCPAMPATAAQFADRIGHIMNYGEGYYGGLYMATMYALAFIESDPKKVVVEALKAIPQESKFHQCMTDVIGWHAQYPNDWKQTWFEIQKKWAEDISTPNGVFATFNIDARVNAAYVIMGLLYGNGDFGRTLEISTRVGQDSDCNPASAGGILGVIMGYNAIPDYWKKGLGDIENLDFPYTSTSLNEVYELSYRHALALNQRNGGSETETDVTLKVEPVPTAPFEESFAGHFPVEKRAINQSYPESLELDFEGIGYAFQFDLGNKANSDTVNRPIRMEVVLDGQPIETVTLNTTFQNRRFNPLFRYQLPEGKHRLQLRFSKTDPEKVNFRVQSMIVYQSKPYRFQ